MITTAPSSNIWTTQGLHGCPYESQSDAELEETCNAITSSQVKPFNTMAVNIKIMIIVLDMGRGGGRGSNAETA